MRFGCIHSSLLFELWSLWDCKKHISLLNFNQGTVKYWFIDSKSQFSDYFVKGTFSLHKISALSENYQLSPTLDLMCIESSHFNHISHLLYKIGRHKQLIHMFPPKKVLCKNCLPTEIHSNIRAESKIFFKLITCLWVWNLSESKYKIEIQYFMPSNRRKMTSIFSFKPNRQLTMG